MSGQDVETEPAIVKQIRPPFRSSDEYLLSEIHARAPPKVENRDLHLYIQFYLSCPVQLPKQSPPSSTPIPSHAILAIPQTG
jgi:hypothetical protein